MMKRIYLLLWLVLLMCMPSFTYRIDGGESFIGGGFGATVNVVRHDVGKSATPKADLPFLLNYDYAIDRNFGIFLSFMPHFSASSIAFLFRAGAKYWFTFLDAPYFPYVSLAFVPSIRFPTNDAVNHFNLGLSPGVGMNFFVMAKFLVGAHFNFNPSVAFVDGHRKFEFSVTSFFDVSLKV